MKLLVIDGNSILNRAFYGIRTLTNSKGLFTNGIYGFLNIYFKFMEEEKPDGACVAFDLKAPTFRHKEYSQYKAQRKGMPDELAMQLPVLKEVLGAMNIPCLSLEGYEADDLIGTLSARMGAQGHDVVIVTGDKDDLQLIGEHTRVRLTVTKFGKPEVTNYDQELFLQNYGFEPIKMIDLKGLAGDSSDNIPGVPGVGEKTAMDLVARYGTVEEIYGQLEQLELKPNVRKKLEEGRESAFLSKRLATIDRDVPMEMSMEDYLIKSCDGDRLYELFQDLEFQSFIDRLELRPKEAPAAQTAVSDDWELALRQLREAEEVYLVLTADELSFAATDAFAFPREHEGYERRTAALLESRCRKVVHDCKGAMTVLGAPLHNISFDTMLAGYLLSATSDRYDLETLTAQLLGERVTGGEAVRRLYPVMQERILANEQEELYYEIELPLARVLFDMEQLGFQVDPEALHAFGEQLDGEIEKSTASIYEMAGEQFNIHSPKQLGKVLFENLGLPVVKKSKTGYSTNADVLEKLRPYHPIIDQITYYRSLTKLKSTYVDGLLKVVDPATKRIHSTFNQTVTATGRISSTEPNLQNIPVRDDLGKELRRMFVPREGCVLLDADYSQIELRVLAHIADDQTMIDAFRSGADIHTITACQVFGVSPDEVTPLLRRRAKAVNFGIVYGIGEFSLAQDIGTTVKEAKLYIQSYFHKYPAIKEYCDRVKDQGKRDGYVTTLYGRRRYLPELAASNFNIRSFGERVAMNTPIQGTAADIIKIAMVRVHDRLLREKLETRLILQVHDELILEAPVAEQERAAQLLQYEMEHAAQLSVPLDVEVKAGVSWYETK